MTFYVRLGEFIRRILASLSESASEGTSFVLILVAMAVGLHFVLGRTYKDLQWPAVQQIDQLGGMVFGFVATTLWIGLALIAIDYLLGTFTPGLEGTRQNLRAYFHSSVLIPIYYKFLPVAFGTLKPWVPRGRLPDIFAVTPP